MGRTYTVNSSAVVGAAAMDLALIIGAARQGSCASSASNARQRMPRRPLRERWRFPMLRYLPATLTNGSGGTTPTPAKQDQGDANATFTAHANDTFSGASSSGNSGNRSGQGAAPNVFLTGLDYSFLQPPDEVNPIYGASPSNCLLCLPAQSI